jgi:hypothetical protein
MSDHPTAHTDAAGPSAAESPLQIPAGTWISVRKGRMIYRGQLLLKHDSLTKPDVKVTSDVAASGYRYLRPPLEVFIVGQTVIR